ncbi:Unknown protein, partial [Striga hermonthica]
SGSRAGDGRVCPVGHRVQPLLAAVDSRLSARAHRHVPVHVMRSTARQSASGSVRQHAQASCAVRVARQCPSGTSSRQPTSVHTSLYPVAYC